jgi:hypothetical protein
VDALLSEVRIDYVRADAVEALLQGLQKLLTGLPQQTIDTPPDEVAKYLEALGMPQVIAAKHLCVMPACLLLAIQDGAQLLHLWAIVYIS